MKNPIIAAVLLAGLWLPAPASAVFVERFEPVWEIGGEGAPKPAPKIPSADYTDPVTGMEFVFVKGGGLSDGGHFR